MSAFTDLLYGKDTKYATKIRRRAAIAVKKAYELNKAENKKIDKVISYIKKILENDK